MILNIYFRINAGSFVDYENLLKFIENKPINNFYSGIIAQYEDIKYVSGSGYFLSKDLVQLIIDNEEKISYICIDDMAIGKLLGELNIPLNYEAFRISYCNGNSEYQKGDKDINKEEIEKINYHYRLRSYDRKMDINKMYKLKEKLCL